MREFTEDGVFFRVFYRNPLCYIFAFCYYHLLFCCKINILHLLKKSENLISAQPRIRAHLE